MSLAIQAKQASLQFGARPQMPAHPLRQLQPVSSDQVLFSGGTKTNTVRRFLATLGMAGAFSTLGMIAAPGMASADTGTTSNGNICVSGSSVNSPSDLPDLQRSSQVFGHTQFVVDLCNSPLLSESTKAEIDNMLADYMNSGDGQMAVVVIPETQQRELNSLATDIFNQVGIGNDSKDDGILMLVNAAAVKENRSTGRMQMVTGSGEVENILTGEKITDLLIDNAIPALKKGDYDTAVSQTVKATTEYVHQELNRPPGEPGPDPAKVMLIIGIILGALVGGGLSIAGLIYLVRRHRDKEERERILQENINNAQDILQKYNSDYQVTAENVYALETARTLLSASNIKGNESDDSETSGKDVVRALTLIEDEVGNDPEIVQLLLEQGLTHSLPLVRAHTVRELTEHKTPEELQEPFLAQLKIEPNEDVFDALKIQLEDLVPAKQMPRYRGGKNTPSTLAERMMDGVSNLGKRISTAIGDALDEIESERAYRQTYSSGSRRRRSGSSYGSSYSSSPTSYTNYGGFSSGFGGGGFGGGGFGGGSSGGSGGGI